MSISSSSVNLIGMSIEITAISRYISYLGIWTLKYIQE